MTRSELDIIKAEQTKVIDTLTKEKKAKYSNMDIQSAMSDHEKQLTKDIAAAWSKINSAIKEWHKSQKESK